MLFKTKILCLDEVFNTIDYSKDYLKNNDVSENLAVIAKKQTNGVGKFAKVWHSPLGNLYLTAALKPFLGYSWHNITDINIFNLLVAFSLLQVIKGVLSNNKYTIFCKWPNDIILNNAKVSGILLENISNSKQELLLVSVGVNIKVAPKLGPGYKSIALDDIGKTTITQVNFAKNLIDNIYGNVTKLSKAQIISNWLQYAYKLNQVITIKVVNTTKTGIFKGVDSNGLLLLEVNNKIETISVGEVY